uniref:Macaca fascicularis brain cDNA clone: QmoA-12233, similar to human KIAA0565 gene product (KIAA0565), mRNA, RefSeq: XM_113947.6 n=1 Tax=Macaca fascicularis TaxID=9541 RepID=I7GEC7_MACFA|nr:unnamed protein product [Macaca fascicularis]
MPGAPSWEQAQHDLETESRQVAGRPTAWASGTPWGRLDPRGLPLSLPPPWPAYLTLAHTLSFLPGGPDGTSELPSGPLPAFSGLPPLPEREPRYLLPPSRKLWPCRPVCTWNSIFPHLMGPR